MLKHVNLRSFFTFCSCQFFVFAYCYTILSENYKNNASNRITTSNEIKKENIQICNDLIIIKYYDDYLNAFSTRRLHSLKEEKESLQNKKYTVDKTQISLKALSKNVKRFLAEIMIDNKRNKIYKKNVQSIFLKHIKFYLIKISLNEYFCKIHELFFFNCLLWLKNLNAAHKILNKFFFLIKNRKHEYICSIKIYVSHCLVLQKLKNDKVSSKILDVKKKVKFKKISHLENLKEKKRMKNINEKSCVHRSAVLSTSFEDKYNLEVNEEIADIFYFYSKNNNFNHKRAKNFKRTIQQNYYLSLDRNIENYIHSDMNPFIYNKIHHFCNSYYKKKNLKNTRNNRINEENISNKRRNLKLLNSTQEMREKEQKTINCDFSSRKVIRNHISKANKKNKKNKSNKTKKINSYSNRVKEEKTKLKIKKVLEKRRNKEIVFGREVNYKVRRLNEKHFLKNNYNNSIYEDRQNDKKNNDYGISHFFEITSSEGKENRRFIKEKVERQKEKQVIVIPVGLIKKLGRFMAHIILVGFTIQKNKGKLDDLSHNKIYEYTRDNRNVDRINFKDIQKLEHDLNYGVYTRKLNILAKQKANNSAVGNIEKVIVSSEKNEKKKEENVKRLLLDRSNVNHNKFFSLKEGISSDKDTVKVLYNIFNTMNNSLFKNSNFFNSQFSSLVSAFIPIFAKGMKPFLEGMYKTFSKAGSEIFLPSTFKNKYGDFFNLGASFDKKEEERDGDHEEKAKKRDGLLFGFRNTENSAKENNLSIGKENEWSENHIYKNLYHSPSSFPSTSSFHFRSFPSSSDLVEMLKEEENRDKKSSERKADLDETLQVGKDQIKRTKELIHLIYKSSKRAVLDSYRDILNSQNISKFVNKIDNSIKEKVVNAIKDNTVKVREAVDESLSIITNKFYETLKTHAEDMDMSRNMGGNENNQNLLIFYIYNVLKKILNDPASTAFTNIGKDVASYVSESLQKRAHVCREAIQNHLKKSHIKLQNIQSMAENNCECQVKSLKKKDFLDILEEYGEKDYNGYFSDQETKNSRKKKKEKEETEQQEKSANKKENAFNSRFFHYPSLTNNYVNELSSQTFSNKELINKIDNSLDFLYYKEQEKLKKKDTLHLEKDTQYIINKEDQTSQRQTPTNNANYIWQDSLNNLQFKKKEVKQQTQILSSTLSNYEQTLLNKHNEYRISVGLSKLKWNEDLMKYIRNFIQTQDMFFECKMIHSPQSHRKKIGIFENIGENLYSTWKALVPPKPERIVEAWYAEIYCYRYGLVGDSCTSYMNEKCKKETGFKKNPMVGHFTQIMWDSTTHVGCAMIECKNYKGEGKKYFAGCSYGSTKSSFGGNLIGQKPFGKSVASLLGLNDQLCSQNWNL